ncbi:MAG TPA: bifunctional 4-hydroxy-2-oxoglutarate aldolase/2-dehydro-3-deoxy-phosphogluconate aldolase, partial [Blastocatellia bacterium]|nr:bifunctional 4-hydroxy-2-oxoglutarate aldolase/2-dehydro-3-deoxy-phosphogluconate aldolase [Blastocatellia bacterium]
FVMSDDEFIRFAAKHRIFAVLGSHSAESALRAAEAAIVGGIRMLEVTLRTPGSFRVISELQHRFGDRVFVGAGSVTSLEQIDRAVKSGATFISMPNTSASLVEACRRHRVASIVGALTPTEVATAWSMGVPLVSLFPTSSMGGPPYLGALAARLGGVRLVASGGVSSENIAEYFTAGAFAIAVGSRLFTRGDLQNENYAAIAERARGMIRLAGAG